MALVARKPRIKFHFVGVEEERRLNNCPAAPFRVAVPLMVVVDPAAKVRVAALVTDLVKLLNVVSPVIDCAVPFNTTLDVPGVIVAPVRVQLPEMFSVALPIDS